jgi:hypothetical protein
MAGSIRLFGFGFVTGPGFRASFLVEPGTAAQKLENEAFSVDD